MNYGRRLVCLPTLCLGDGDGDEGDGAGRDEGRPNSERRGVKDASGRRTHTPRTDRDE